MKPNFSLFDLPKNGFGILFFLKQFVEEKREENSTYYQQTRKCQKNAYFPGEAATANAKNGGKVVVTWSRLRLGTLSAKVQNTGPLLKRVGCRGSATPQLTRL